MAVKLICCTTCWLYILRIVCLVYFQQLTATAVRRERGEARREVRVYAHICGFLCVKLRPKFDHFLAVDR